MSNKSNPIEALVKEAIDKGVALEASDIRELRATSEKAAVLLKGIFWVGIVIFNLALWVPLPIAINQTALYIIAFLALLIALVAPILGLRKHQLNLELLKVTKQTLKRKTANEAGRAYIDQVRQQGRPFVMVEFEALEGSKWGANQASTD